MLSLPLSSLLLILGDKLERQAPPITKETGHVFHPVVRVEQGCHGIEQVFVAMQVFLFLDELELESGPDRLVLQTVIVLDIVNQFLEQVSAVVDLEQSRVLLLIRVDARDLMLHGARLLVFDAILLIMVVL